MIATIDDLIGFVRRRHRDCRLPSVLDPALIPSELPVPLKELYLALGNWMEPNLAGDESPFLFSAHHRLVPLSELERYGETVEFAIANLSTWTCRCAAREADPPVYAAEYWGGPPDDIKRVCDSLSSFLVTFCLTEEVFASQCIASSINAPTETMRERLAATGKCLFSPDADALTAVFDGELVPLWMNGRHVADKVAHCYYQVAGTDMIVMTDHNSVRAGGAEQELALHLREPERMAIECRDPILVDDGDGPVQAIPFRLAVLREQLLAQARSHPVP